MRSAIDGVRVQPDPAEVSPPVTSATGPATESLPVLLQDAARRLHPGVGEAVWTPDGRSVLFICDGSLYRAPAAGGTIERLPFTPAARSRLAFSPDGKHALVDPGRRPLAMEPDDERGRCARRIVAAPAVGNIPGSAYLEPRRRAHFAALVARQPADRDALGRPAAGAQDAVSELPRRRGADHDAATRSPRATTIRFGRWLSSTSRRARLQFIDLPDPTDRRISSYRVVARRQPPADRSERGGREGPLDLRSPPPTGFVRKSCCTSAARWPAPPPPRRPYGPPTGRAMARASSTSPTSMDGIVYASSRLRPEPIDPLTPGDWDVVSTAFDGNTFATSPRTREVFFLATKKNPYERQVYRMSEKGGPIAQITTLARHPSAVSSRPTAPRVALLRSDDLTPTELYIAPAKGGGGAAGDRVASEGVLPTQLGPAAVRDLQEPRR